MQAASEAEGTIRLRIVLKPDFSTIIAKAGLSITEFAAIAGIERTTLHALINPSQHPQRKGGMQRTTAWKIASAYAQRTGMSLEDAYKALLNEEMR